MKVYYVKSISKRRAGSTAAPPQHGATTPQERHVDTEPAESASVPIPRQAKKLLTHRRRRRFGLYKGLLIFVAAMVVCIFAGAYFLWGYLYSYEATRVDHLLLAFQEEMDYSFWESKVEEAIAARLTEFESNPRAILASHIHRIRDARFTMRQLYDESTDDVLVYAVRAGAADIGLLRIVAGENAGYSLHFWEADSVELLDTFVDGLARSIFITASANADVLVNGMLVSHDYLTDGEYEYGATYMIEGIFNDIVEINVIELDGRISLPVYSENDEYLFPISLPFSRYFSVEIPENFSVFIDDELVSNEYITDDQILLPIFEDIFQPSDAPLRYRRYEIGRGGFFLEPRITIRDALGEEKEYDISDDGTLVSIAEYSAQLKAQHEADVEAFMQAYISYYTNMNRTARRSLNTAANYMVRDTALLGRLQGALSTIELSYPISVTRNSLDIDNFIAYNDDYFSCEVMYSVTVRNAVTTFDLEQHYQILYQLTGDRWLVLHMIGI